METLMPSSEGDAIREIVIIIVGLIIRAFERRRLKKESHAQSEN